MNYRRKRDCSEVGTTQIAPGDKYDRGDGRGEKKRKRSGPGLQKRAGD